MTEEPAPERMIRKVGFFHFGCKGNSDQIGSLRASLLEASETYDLSDSLVVLPEAFNIFDYSISNSLPDSSVDTNLRKLSLEFGVALVVGLVEAESDESYSSAYLIDKDVRKLLSRKVEDDRSNNYKPSEKCDRPIRYRGVCLSALICMDAAGYNQNNKRHASILERLGSCGDFPKLLCVPAHLTSRPSTNMANRWPEHLIIVLSNSYVDTDAPSVIRIGGKQPICYCEAKNVIRIEPLIAVA